MLITGLVVLIAFTTGQWLPNYDAKIVGFGTCATDTEFKVQSVFIAGVEPVYICGKTEGTTFRNVVIYVFSNEQVIYLGRIGIEPGYFYLKFPNSLHQVGRYRAEVRQEKLIVFKTEFEIR